MGVLVEPEGSGVRLAPAPDRLGQEPDRERADGGDLELVGFERSGGARRAGGALCVGDRGARVGSSPSPAPVSRRPPGSRSISCTPSSVSSARICCDSEGWVTLTFCAAARNDRSLTTAMKYSSWRKVRVQTSGGE
jgi:hypothetical protein